MFFQSLLLLLLATTQSLLAAEPQHSVRSLHDEVGFTYGLSKITLKSTDPELQCGMRRAAFGDPMLGEVIYANMMIPTDGETLCEFPQYLVDNPQPDASFESFKVPIALFVSPEGCSVEQKARVALELQSTVSQHIKYLILDIATEKDELYELHPDDPAIIAATGTDDDEFASLGIFSINRWCGSKVRSLLLSGVNGDPRFMQPTNLDRRFYVIIDNTYEDNFSSNERDGQSVDQFYWLRHLLFGLLVAAPIARAIYILYQGGAHLRIRRNEQGRIAGIHFVRPTLHFLRPIQPTGAPSTVISENEFNALPEILYRPLPEEEQDQAETPPSEVDVVVSKANAISTVDEVQRGDVEQPLPLSLAEDVPAGQTASAYSEEGPVVDLTTTCTTCSICIDEFEVGERLTLLPRCQHAFHRDCIMPWLLERQGRCPLCKTHVLQDEQDNSVASDADLNENADADEESTENGSSIANRD